MKRHPTAALLRLRKKDEQQRNQGLKGRILNSKDGKFGQQPIGQRNRSVGLEGVRSDARKLERSHRVKGVGLKARSARIVPQFIKVRLDGLLQIGQRAEHVVLQVEQVGP
ncbi:MAG: hypothetical protein DYH04_15085 [Nitrospira sp. NTP2]|nr:hypothetical protein [Nitrospira sp. NTP2]RIK56436.1 MAG: hypothetical protein DCC63_17305 [Nitrospira sp.]